MTDKRYSLAEAATELGTTVFAMRRAADRGTIETVRDGSRRYVTTTELERYRRDRLGRVGRPMGKPRNFDEIRRNAPDSPEVVARSDAMKTAERLAQLRQLRGTSSDLERRDDAFLVTLRDQVHALGGQLRLVADFGDEAYEIALTSA